MISSSLPAEFIKLRRPGSAAMVAVDTGSLSEADAKVIARGITIFALASVLANVHVKTVALAMGIHPLGSFGSPTARSVCNAKGSEPWRRIKPCLNPAVCRHGKSKKPILL
tara:strand:- start:1505 stop:1837 length:333 start_codon:yes stop_codon:yes gene_type:complete